MAKNQTHKIDVDDVVDDVPDGADVGALADTLVDRGRAVLDPVSYTHLTLPTNREV